jgi:hypothetical protein
MGNSQYHLAVAGGSWAWGNSKRQGKMMNETGPINSNVKRALWFAIAGGVSIGATALYLFARRAASQQLRARPVLREQPVDDRGTGQAEASQLLRNLRERGFDASYQKFSIALGRPAEEIEAWDAGTEVIDDDVVMKARGIALQRGIAIE